MVAEISPDGRFRFVKEGSCGGAGTGYDTENGLLVGWNVLNLREMSLEQRESAKRSIELLERLNHSHVLGVHSCWNAPLPSTSSGRPSRLLRWKAEGAGFPKEEDSAGDEEEEDEEDDEDEEEGRLVYLTTSCITLEAFINAKVELLRWRVVKRWTAQVLEALAFFHGQSPPVVHKNLSLDSIYIDTSKSHIFVGGVEDIIAPACPCPGPLRPAPPQSGSGRGGGSVNGRGGHGRSSQRNGQKSWGGKAWHRVVGGGGGGGQPGRDHHQPEGNQDRDNSAGKDDEDSGFDRNGDSDGGNGTKGAIHADGRVILDREPAAVVERAGGGSSGSSGGGGGGVAAAAAGGDGEPGVAAVALVGAVETPGAKRDVRTLGTLLIEMVLKKKLDPELAGCDHFLAALPTISGWPSSVVDFLRLCRAPPDERPTAEELLAHPFLEIGTDIDDEPTYRDSGAIEAAGRLAVEEAEAVEEEGEGVLLGVAANAGAGAGAGTAANMRAPPTLLPLLVNTSCSGVTASTASLSSSSGATTRVGGGSAATSPSSSAAAAVAAAAAAAASAAAEVPVVAVAGSRHSSCFRFRRGQVTPPPLFVSPATATGGSGSGTGADSKPVQRGDPSFSADSGGGGVGAGVGAGTARGWPSYARSPGYPPSCVSTESPSPSSPSAAPSFGGVPTTPSPPAARGFAYDPGNSGGGIPGARAGTGAAAVEPGAEGGGGAAGTGGGTGGVGGRGGLSVRGAAGGIVGRTGSLPFLPPGVSAATLANATAIAARMGGSFSSNAPRQQQQQHPFRVIGGGGARGATLSGGRNRSMSYSDRQHMLSATGGGGGSAAGGKGDRFASGFLGGSFAEGGGGGAAGGAGLPSASGSMASMVGRSRSASEDAVWDMLPSDESQCRRPFSVSAVEGRHGYL